MTKVQTLISDLAERAIHTEEEGIFGPHKNFLSVLAWAFKMREQRLILRLQDGNSVERLKQNLIDTAMYSLIAAHRMIEADPEVSAYSSSTAAIKAVEAELEAGLDTGSIYMVSMGDTNHLLAEIDRLLLECLEIYALFLEGERNQGSQIQVQLVSAAAAALIAAWAIETDLASTAP